MTSQQTRQAPVVPRPLNAVERLQRIKDHQTSLLREIADNWAGWLFSALLHVAVIVLLVVLVVSVVQKEKEYTLDTGYDNSLRQLMDPSLDDVIKRSPVDVDIDQLPSVDANKQDTTPGYTEMDPGAPDFLTLGGEPDRTGAGRGRWGGSSRQGLEQLHQRPADPRPGRGVRLRLDRFDGRHHPGDQDPHPAAHEGCRLPGPRRAPGSGHVPR